MKLNYFLVVILILLSSSLCKEMKVSPATYQVTISNLHPKQNLSPIVVITHNDDFELFVAGTKCSRELQMVAEGGDSSGFEKLESGKENLKMEILQVMVIEGEKNQTISPGENVTFEIVLDQCHPFFSLATKVMMTNAGFIALNSQYFSLMDFYKEIFLYVWDAGTKKNDEKLSSIQRGFSQDTTGAVGFVSIHTGIHGVGDLKPQDWDWRNPFARVIISRTSYQLKKQTPKPRSSKTHQLRKETPKPRETNLKKETPKPRSSKLKKKKLQNQEKLKHTN